VRLRRRRWKKSASSFYSRDRGIIEVKHYDLATVDLFDCDMRWSCSNSTGHQPVQARPCPAEVVKKIQVVMLLVKEDTGS